MTRTNTTDPAALADDMSRDLGLARGKVEPFTISGHEPVFDSRFALATAAAIAHGLIGEGVSAIWEQRTGVRQPVEVDLRAAGASLVGFALLRLREPTGDLAGWEPAPDNDGWIAAGSLGVLAGHNPPNAATNAYRTADGRWIQLHGGYPHLAEGLYDLLGASPDRASVAQAVSARRAFELEDDIASAGLCGVVARTNHEWRTHPQGAAIAARPVVEIIRLGDAPPRVPADGPRPLSGIRVLDLTRVLAGPTCARALAAQGADVLNVCAPDAPYVLPFVLDTGHGKRTAFVELPPDGPGRLQPMARTADVVCDSYRTGALEHHGLGAIDIARENPGVIVAQLNCYGFGGPWDERRGWEQLAQNAVGLATPDNASNEPVIVPAAACDYTSGALLAAGVLEALLRQRTEGGSWLVRASLCRTGMWIHDLPELDHGTATGIGDAADLLADVATAWGQLGYLRPLPYLPVTPPFFDAPPSPLGSHALGWRA